MKNSWYKNNKLLIVALLLTVIFSSCNKNNDPVPDQPQFTYLQSDEQSSTITQAPTQFVFSALGTQYDDAKGLSAYIQTDATVYKITYNTTFQDSALTVSGLVCVPNNAGKYPVLCFQNGTNVEYSKAPTEDSGNQLFQVLESVSTMGFVVVIPDYPGFGASKQVLHPYLEKDNTVPCLVDILKATREFVSQDKVAAGLNDDLYIMGYSQGGWATMQLQSEIEQNGLAGYNLKASSCGAGPYNLNYLNFMFASADTYPMPYFIAYLMDAYSTHGQFTNPLSDVFAEPYASEIPALFNGTNTGEEINAQLTTNIADLLQPAFRTGFQANPDYQSIQTAFKNNSVKAWNLSTPTRLYHGDADPVVPIEMSQNLYKDFTDLGVSGDKIQLVTMPGVSHTSGILPFGLASLKWFLELENK
ncbi:MAG TPA: alpha/beta fold hydrolase [Sunxiuqinia sp.]|nr:alpha/beta fold hydrolase [Sunxiuqinia sp.]